MTELDPTQPDLAEDDLNRSREQHPGQHRETSAQLQEAVIELVATCQGWSLDDAMVALNESLARRGHPQQPQRWVEAVATDAIAGRTYVVSSQALQDLEETVEAHDHVQQSTGRDRGGDPA